LDRFRSVKDLKRHRRLRDDPPRTVVRQQNTASTINKSSLAPNLRLRAASLSLQPSADGWCQETFRRSPQGSLHQRSKLSIGEVGKIPTPLRAMSRNELA